MGSQGLLDEIMYSHIKVLCLFQHVCCFLKGLCHNGVQHSIGGGDGIRGPHHAELKFIARKGKG